VREQRFAGIGRRNATAVSVEQGLLQINFELTDLMAERGLRNVEQ